jgi:hypothetical protein
MAAVFLSARCTRPSTSRRARFGRRAGENDDQPEYPTRSRSEHAIQNSARTTAAPSKKHRTLVATFGAFHPRRLRQSPVVFATVLAATIIGILGLRALMAGAPAAQPGLELSGTLWLLAFFALAIEVIVDRCSGRREGDR